jgi:hypothetical protein
MVFNFYPEHESSMMKCLAIAATLIRNSVDARVYPITTLLSLLQSKKELPDCEVLIVPDLCVAEFAIQPWERKSLYGILLTRFGSDKMTIGYIESLAAVEKNYGKQFAEFLASHYTISIKEAALEQV